MASSSRQQRKRPELPLIFCPDCGWRKVMELTSHTEKNPDRVFVTCPNQQKGKGKDRKGCEFYLWDDEYKEYLKVNHGYKSEIATQQETMHPTVVEDEETGLLQNAVKKSHDQEICILLKALVAVGVVCIVVLICILVVVILK